MSERSAVILGGGGVTGIAWETGILLGLADKGVDLAGADAIIGSSAGSFVGAYLAAGVVEKYFDAQFDDDVTEIAATMSEDCIAAYLEAIAEGKDDPVRMARSLGRMAVAATTVSAEARAAVVAARLPSEDWPAGPLQMTALDAETGALHLFDKDSGVPIVTAAAASGAVPGLWPVVTALGRTWIDGGSCSPTNAALGADYDRVVVIAPAADGLPGMRGTRSEVADLAAAGIDVILIVPDEHTTEAIGPNVFDPTRRGPAAAAGRLQGAAEATKVGSALQQF
ncbi:patatin-like phospholipase family protein [Mycobacterium sp. DL440]|uniref:patatin-like phospholipase family protein n=1 Tax=Mycobacterium sp. DL440 TaxID=2675523 RepID=UPI00142496CC|nr:patatin-like phospholipase family protein [Mycobacterium sp. DL440]